MQDELDRVLSDLQLEFRRNWSACRQSATKHRRMLPTLASEMDGAADAYFTAAVKVGHLREALLSPTETEENTQ